MQGPLMITQVGEAGQALLERVNGAVRHPRPLSPIRWAPRGS